jgi:hypothetical protein
MGVGADNTAAVVFGGQSPGGTYNNTETWNGTSWTEVGNLNAVRTKGASVGASLTAALCVGGNPGKTANTESWNGTAWTEVNNLNTGRAELGVAGTTAAGLAFSGEAPGGNTTASEEWNDPVLSVKTVDTD